MAITTYSELKTAVANWLDRDDLTTRIPEFIALAEARIFNEEGLNLRSMELRMTADTVAGTQYYGLPERFKAMRFVNLISESPVVELQYMPPERFHDFKAYKDGTQDVPEAFTIIGDELKLGPIPAAVYTMEMMLYQTFPALSDSQTTNALLTAHPDIYLYAAMLEAGVYLRDPEMKNDFIEYYNSAVRRMIDQDKADRYPTGSGSIRTEISDILTSSRNYWWDFQR